MRMKNTSMGRPTQLGVTPARPTARPVSPAPSKRAPAQTATRTNAMNKLNGLSRQTPASGPIGTSGIFKRMKAAKKGM